MKRVLFTTIAFTVFAIILTAGVMDDNGRAGVTGAPGELTCNQTSCHNSYALNSGTGSVSATSTMNNWTYIPGTTYSISVKVRRIGNVLFGVGAEVLKPNGDNAGTLVVTNTSRTSIKSRLIGSYYRRSIVHTLNGGRLNDSCVFTFNWTAPSTNIGDVTLYAAGNCSNNNTTAVGDYIYTMNQLISPDLTSGVNDLLQSSHSFTLFPVPASEFVTLRLDNLNTSEGSITLTDMSGKNIETLFSGTLNAGLFEKQLSLPSVKSGTYLITVQTAEGSRTKRLMIR